MQRTDRVAFHAGNAVRANIESQTINPSKKSMKSTAGLGKNGRVAPATDSAAIPFTMFALRERAASCDAARLLT
jgi:hypothetical protein